MGENKEEISTVGKLIEVLRRLGKEDDILYYFRGHRDEAAYSVRPSIYRQPRLIRNEHKLFREMIARCPQEFEKLATTFEKLVKMQHYSCPTRLLDVTGNPLVALYFACKESPASGKGHPDGELKVFRIPRDKLKYDDSDSVTLVANLAKIPSDFSIDTTSRSDIAKFNASDEVGKLLHEVKHDKPFFQNIVHSEDLETVFCVKAKLDNPRIIRQDGAFLLFGMNGSKTECAEMPPEFEPSVGRLIVPHAKKEDIRSELEYLAICQASLFPEIDSVARYLNDAPWL